MENFLNFLGQGVNTISNFIWAMAMPIIIILMIIIVTRMIGRVRKRTTVNHGLHIFKTMKDSIVVMGTVIGTGALIGVLGSLSSMASEGQAYIEGTVLWAFIGLFLLAPLAYSETLMGKILNKTTVESVRKFLGEGFCNLYKIVFTIIFVFGFGGFQFSAIDAAVNIVSLKTGFGNITNIKMFLFVVVPIMIALSVVVLLRKQGLIIKSLTVLTTISVTVYIVFFLMFFFKTYDYWGIFFSRMFDSMKDPVSMLIGVPLGLMIGIQKLMQVTDVGIGVYGMVAKQTKRSHREAALSSAMVILMLFIVGIFATTYITSFGVSHHMIDILSSNANVLTGYYDTSISQLGVFGGAAVAIFSVLTGISALLGRYYYLTMIVEKNEKLRIATYIVNLTITGALAVFGFSLVFNLVDLLIFVAFAINLAILYKFTSKHWVAYIVDSESDVTGERVEIKEI